MNTSNDQQLDVHNLWDISKFLDRKDWIFIGRQLRVNPTELDKIDNNYNNSYRECAYQMLTTWHEAMPDGTLQDLFTALKELGWEKSIRKIKECFLNKENPGCHPARLLQDFEAMKAKYQKINDAMLQYMKEQEEFSQKIANMEMESQNVQDTIKQKDDHRIKLEEFQKDIELMRQEKACMLQELEEAKIAGKANQYEIKETLEKYLTATECLHDIQKQNERDFRNAQEDWKRSLDNLELEKEALRTQIAENEMTRTMDAMTTRYERTIQELTDQMKGEGCNVS